MCSVACVCACAGMSIDSGLHHNVGAQQQRPPEAVVLSTVCFYCDHPPPFSSVFSLSSSCLSVSLSLYDLSFFFTPPQLPSPRSTQSWFALQCCFHLGAKRYTRVVQMRLLCFAPLVVRRNNKQKVERTPKVTLAKRSDPASGLRSCSCLHYAVPRTLLSRSYALAHISLRHI